MIDIVQWYYILIAFVFFVFSLLFYLDFKRNRSVLRYGELIESVLCAILGILFLILVYIL